MLASPSSVSSASSPGLVLLRQPIFASTAGKGVVNDGSSAMMSDDSPPRSESGARPATLTRRITARDADDDIRRGNAR
ncbi:hypothetical protein GMORB2_0040 [Geosmithia morbida]|uniref:Uncharacterized protein n=1 Tax=Geosmithia morbida TaxID=1094350 RepID=A0A9P5D9A0_9HYPO|nr:uncharacterized protein GMORB2_0040 [Geosmithia morbida]KAF4126304.1 hypothetical protein GMORB2_0040 [Geosmithia morbida]